MVEEIFDDDSIGEESISFLNTQNVHGNGLFHF